MKIQIKAIDRKNNKLVVPKPVNAVQFRKNELSQQAAGRKFAITLLPAVPNIPWVQMEVIDGRKKKYTVEVFDRFSVKCQCSCTDFIEDQSNYCVHIAAVDNVKNNQVIFTRHDTKVLPWCSAYRHRILNLPFSFSGYRNPKFTYYDASTGQISSYGGSLPGAVDSSAVTTLKKIKAINVATTAKYALATEPDDAGLLQTVSLYDYQKVIFAKMVKARRAICSMTMGSGKTITTICCYAWMKQNIKPDARLLVVCPKSLRLQWGSEIARVIGQTSIQVTKVADLAKPGNIFITTYQYFTRHADEFAKQTYDCVVVDEIQFVKNSDTKTWKAISKVKSDFFYGLSGTVIENRLDDLYSIMEIINPGHLGPKWKFDEKFQNLVSLTKSKILYKGVKNVAVLQNELREHVFSYDQLVLPNITHTTIDTILTKSEESFHDKYMEEAKKLIAKSLSGGASMGERMMIQAFLLKARQACNGEELLTKNPSRNASSKVGKLLDLVDQVCITNNEKLVVFSEWTEMLDICKRFVGTKVGYVSYTGKETPKQRAAAVEKFQKDPSCMIFFSSEAGGVGLDGLQLAAWNIVHLELPWNPSRLDQRTGRVYRLLQKKDVNVYYLISNGGIEKQIEKLLTDKREIRELTLKDLTI
ncbi:MAG: DEAD/DEAH box helicase [Candidatus Paceibacterota bacterium]|jgi:superfamily II DNA or RNA helicase